MDVFDFTPEDEVWESWNLPCWRKVKLTLWSRRRTSKAPHGGAQGRQVGLVATRTGGSTPESP